MTREQTIAFILDNFASMGASRLQLLKENLLMKISENRIHYNLRYFEEH